MNDDGKYYVFFDLDGTLTDVNSGFALFRAACSKGLVSKHGILNALWLSLLYKLHLTDAGKLINVMGKWLEGTDRKIFEEVAADAVNRYLAASVHPEAKAEIAIHRSNKASVILLSSAVEEICMPMVPILGIDHCICTKMECIDGKMTGFPAGEYCYGDVKRKRISEFLINEKAEISKAYYYADSFSDLPALDFVGNPVCVNPERKLRQIARKEKWPVKIWRN